MLKEARKRSLLPQLSEAASSGTQDRTAGPADGTAEVQVPAEQLLAAAVHCEEPVRLDALTLACHSPRSAAMPGVYRVQAFQEGQGVSSQSRHGSWSMHQKVMQT